jgi:phosphoenolpyruvate phosphomutase
MQAEQEMDDEILVCYADILYEKRVLQKVLESKSDIGVTIDEDYWEYWSARADKPEEDIESLVIDDTGKIIDLGNTKCSRDEAKVRYVGLIKFSKVGVEVLKRIYHENKEKHFHQEQPWLRSKSFKKAYMTCILQAIINSGQRIEPIIIRRGWLEFDTVEDYEKYNQWLEEGSLQRFFSFS